MKSEAQRKVELALAMTRINPRRRRHSRDYWEMQAQALPYLNHQTAAANMKRERRRMRNIRNARRMGL